MKMISHFMAIVHGFVAFLFGCAALMLIVIATRIGWSAFASRLDSAEALAIIEALGILAIGVVALQIAKTMVEEEVVREAHISAPTRVRRFLSRFMVVVVVALAIEGLVATFRALHEDPSQLVYAAVLIAAVALLLIGWGLFVRFNRFAEELEPEAMQQAKDEDRKLDE